MHRSALAPLLFACLACPAFAQETTPAEKRLDGADTQPRLTREERLDRLFNHLINEYSNVLKSKDWANRSVACVSLTQVPGPKATGKLFDVLTTDTMGITRLVAWHCLLARAKYFDAQEHDRLLKETLTLAEKDFFQGESRVHLLNYLALQNPTKATKKAWANVFAKTNLRADGAPTYYATPNGMTVLTNLGNDIAVLQALADCLKAWRSPDLVEFLINRMAVLDDAYRAEYVLRIAGDLRQFNRLEKPIVPLAVLYSPKGSRTAWQIAAENYAAWAKANKEKWVERDATKDLRVDVKSPHVPTPDLMIENISTLDPKWRRDLELRMPEIRSLNISFVVDATGSMQEGIAWVRHQVPQIMKALTLICREPKMGVTFYRDHGDEFVTKMSAMVGPAQVEQLSTYIGGQLAKGGGDVPEAIQDALAATIDKNPWPTVASARKIIILVGDAPPHAKTQKTIETAVTELQKKGFRVYTVSLHERSDETFRTIAEAGGGKTIPVVLEGRRLDHAYDIGAALQIQPWLKYHEWYVFERQPARLPRLQMGMRPTADTQPAASAFSGDAGKVELLQQILVDAINPQFKERIAPVVSVLIDGMTENAPPEKRVEQAAYTPQKPPQIEGPTHIEPHDPQKR